MEKRNYDQDEILIRQALKDQFPQNFNMMKGARTKMKPKRMLKKGFIVLLIAASLMVVTVSAAHYMGAFERLTALIGQERADELTPLEFGNIEKVQSAQSDENIAIELVAIEMTDDAAYIYFTLQDLVSDRLDGEFTISHQLFPVKPIDDFIVTVHAPEIIHRDAAGVVTFRSRFVYSHALEGLELTYSIQEIRFNDFHHPLQLVDINLADFAFEAPTALLQTNSPALSTSGVDSAEVTRRYVAKIMGEGLPVLAPNQLNFDFGLNGVHAVISGLGFVNGRFHIQVHNPNVPESHVILWVLHERYVDKLDIDNVLQNNISDLFSTQFRVAEDGTLHRDTDGNSGAFGDTHFESVMDLDNVYEYVLAVSAFGFERINIDWAVTFNITAEPIEPNFASETPLYSPQQPYGSITLPLTPEQQHDLQRHSFQIVGDPYIVDTESGSVIRLGGDSRIDINLPGDRVYSLDFGLNKQNAPENNAVTLVINGDYQLEGILQLSNHENWYNVEFEFSAQAPIIMIDLIANDLWDIEVGGLSVNIFPVEYTFLFR